MIMHACVYKIDGVWCT